MKKLVNGIVEFRKNLMPSYLEKFAQLALGQSPDTLFIACSDSRVVPNLFASTDPGDLFVIRNVGNLIPRCALDGRSIADESEAAAIEFSLLNLNVKDIIVCGHSECGAMKALYQGREKIESPNLRGWLRHADESLSKVHLGQSSLSPINYLSQLNVLAQMQNLLSYPVVNQRVNAGSLKIHGWWFELSQAGVHAFDATTQKFELIDEEAAEKILAKL